MRRLSIVDLAPGHQPISNEDGTVWIVFNGEIYNHAELREQLQARGHRYRTNSDTETIVHLYEEYGRDCVQHLRGMFAFAIWDIKKAAGSSSRVIVWALSRSITGLTPRIVALRFRNQSSSARTERSPSSIAQALPEYLAFGYVSGNETFYRRHCEA